MMTKNKIILAVIIFLLLFFAFFVFLVGPEISRMREVGLKIREQEEKIASLDKRIGNMKIFNEYYLEKKDEFSKIDKIFINPQMPLDFIDFLDSAAEECGVSVNYSPSLPVKMKKDYWPSINFQITSLGAFSPSLKFVSKLEHSPYLVEIHGLEISKNNEASDVGNKDFVPVSGTLKTNIFLKIYTK